jgi:hypothetical protein
MITAFIYFYPVLILVAMFLRMDPFDHDATLQFSRQTYVFVLTIIVNIIIFTIEVCLSFMLYYQNKKYIELFMKEETEYRRKLF